MTYIQQNVIYFSTITPYMVHHRLNGVKPRDDNNEHYYYILYCIVLWKRRCGRRHDKSSDERRGKCLIEGTVLETVRII